MKTATEGEWRKLVAAARRVSRRAYAPHSQLHVGAALLGRKGRVFTGCNVENASLGLTICAERAALFSAIAEGEREFVALAVATPDSEPLSPCGACRQALAEFCRELPIVSVGEGDGRAQLQLSALLPATFRLPQDERQPAKAGERKASREALNRRERPRGVRKRAS
jgi:cytidine deaminase